MAVGNLRRREGRCRHAVDLGEHIVEIDQARPRQRALGRDMIEAPAHAVEDGALARIGGRHGGVAALARERQPAIRRRHQRRHAKTAARPEHADRRLGRRRAGTDGEAIGVLEPRHRKRARREIVDDEKARQTEMLTQAADGEGPGMIGERHRIGGDRSRPGERRVLRRRFGGTFGEICRERLFDARIVVAGENAHLLDAAVAVLAGKAGVGRADIREKATRRRCRRHAWCTAAASDSAATKLSRHVAMSFRRSVAIIARQRSTRSTSGMASAS